MIRSKRCKQCLMCHKLQKTTRAGEPVTGGLLCLLRLRPNLRRICCILKTMASPSTARIFQIAFVRIIICRIVRRIIRAEHYLRCEIEFPITEAVEPASIFHIVAADGFMKTDGELFYVQFAICVDDDDGIRRGRSIVHGFHRSHIPLGERTSLTTGRDTTARFFGW